MSKRRTRLSFLAIALCFFFLVSLPGCEAKAAAVTPPQQPAAARIEAQIAPVRLKINEGEVDGRRAEYPLLIYNSITYIPLTWNLCQALGMRYIYSTAGGLVVVPNPNSPPVALKQDLLSQDKPDQEPGSAVTTNTVTQAVYISGEKIDNSQQQWPLLLYKDITYLPLTWYFAHDLLQISYTYNHEALLLSLVRPHDKLRISERQLAQIVSAARDKINREALSAVSTTTVSGVRSTQIVVHSVPAQKTVWQITYSYPAATQQHLLSLPLVAPSAGASADVYGVVYNTLSATSTSSDTRLYRSDNGISWRNLSTTNTAELPQPPQIPNFKLNTLPGGWPIFCAEGRWYFELEDMALKQQPDGSGHIWLFTYRFDYNTNSLQRITMQEVPLLHGLPSTAATAIVTVTEVEYGEIKNLPKP